MPTLVPLISIVLALIAIISLRFQVRNWGRLRSATLPSDERGYLRGVVQRRTLNAFLLLSLSAVFAWIVFSGSLEELGRLSRVKGEDLTPEDRASLKNLVVHWMVVLGLVFIIMMIAVADYVATGLYGRQQLRRIRGEQTTLLERDLAMVRQQKLNDRMKKKQ